MNDCALTLSVSKTEDGELSRLPGGPTVLICCHPTKNAESLVPRGGGAFQVDGKPPRRRMAGEVWPCDERGREERSCNPSTPSSLNRLTPFANGLRGRVKAPRNSRF